MAINFPTSIDTLTNPQSTDTLDSPSHSSQHSDLNDAVEALEAKVGADSSAVSSSHDYKIDTLETDVDTLETDVDTLETDVDTLETDVDTLETDVDTLETDVDTLETDVDTLEAAQPTGDIVGTTDTQTLANKTLTSPVISEDSAISFGDSSAQMFMDSDYISDNDVWVIDTPVERGILFVVSTSGGGITGIAQCWAGHPYMNSLTSEGITWDTGVYDGTTGADGNVSVSCSGGNIYVENRVGGNRHFTVIIFGRTI